MGKQYIASLSYGKDSLAMLHVITDILHWPLTRIITADVWATDTIPAELPPMVEFKEKADMIIKERWGIDVEHLYAKKKTDGGGQKSRLTKSYSISDLKTPAENGNSSRSSSENALTQQASPTFMVSLRSSDLGAIQDLKSPHLKQYEKKSYQDVFYRVRSQKRATKPGQIYGFPLLRGAWCNSELKRDVIKSFILTSKARWCSISE